MSGSFVTASANTVVASDLHMRKLLASMINYDMYNRGVKFKELLRLAAQGDRYVQC